MTLPVPTRRQLRNAASAGVEAASFSQLAFQLAWSSSATVAMRLPMFAAAGFGDVKAMGEVQRAVVEKYAATVESQVAATAAMWRLGMSFWPGGGGSAAQMAAMSGLAHASLRPMARRTRANAKRLGRDLTASLTASR